MRMCDGKEYVVAMMVNKKKKIDDDDDDDDDDDEEEEEEGEGVVQEGGENAYSATVSGPSVP